MGKWFIILLLQIGCTGGNNEWSSETQENLKKDCKNMNSEEYELVSTIARGLVFQATTNPHSTFLMGVKGFKNDKDKKRDLKKKETKKEQNNVIDFIDYLKNKRILNQ